VAPKVLFIYNDPTAPEALLGDVFGENGFDVETVVPVSADRVGDPFFDFDFPDPTGYDVIVPLGSRFSVHDERFRGTWVDTEMQMVRDAAAAGVGVLGVCFGGQLVAEALGGSVAKSPAPELGWYQIDSAATEFIPGGPWFQWHSDRFTPPADATVIASNANATQAFVLGSALGLQFHPELDGPLLELWLAADSSGDVPSLGIDVDELRGRTAAEQDAAIGRLRTLVKGFLDRVANTSHPS
jgi:GMP synthase-like glutamine amidotransferase